MTSPASRRENHQAAGPSNFAILDDSISVVESRCVEWLGISLGAWGWLGWSEGGVGDGGFATETGMDVSSCWLSSVGSSSSTVVVVVVFSIVMRVFVGAGPSCLASVVCVTGGSSLWSLGVGALLVMAARRSCS